MARTWLTAVLGTVCVATISAGRADAQYASVYGGPGGFGFGYSAAPTYQQTPAYRSPGYCGPRATHHGAREGNLAREGYLEGELYWETGIAPGRPMSPAEAGGFAAGQRRAAERPWVADPAKQLGWQEAQFFNQTGILPNHRLSPAEMQGFQAAERRAGYAPW